MWVLSSWVDLATTSIKEENMKKIITEEQAEQLWRNEESKELGLELEEEGDWDDDGKYQHLSCIYRDKEDKFWELGVTRCGSYFTDYNFDFSRDLTEVRSGEKVITTWYVVEDKEESNE